MDALGVETTLAASAVHDSRPLVPRPVQLPHRCSAQLWWLAAANIGVLALLTL